MHELLYDMSLQVTSLLTELDKAPSIVWLFLETEVCFPHDKGSARNTRYTEIYPLCAIAIEILRDKLALIMAILHTEVGFSYCSNIAPRCSAYVCDL